MLVDVAGRYPSAVALIDGDATIDFATTLAASIAAAEQLLGRGIGPGQTIGLLLPNSWRYAVAYFGAQLAGAIPVLLNTRFTTREIAHVCQDGRVALVVTDGVLGGRVEASDLDVPTVLIDDVVSEVEMLRCLGDARSAADDLPGLSRTGTDVAQLLYTSGTTGNPKGVMQLHSNLMFNARTVRERLGAAPGERTLIAAPMFHAIGIVSQLVGFVSAGATCVIMPSFEATKATRLIAQEKVTIFAGVAAMLRLILLKADVLGADLSHLKLFVMGGSPVPASLPDEVAARLPNVTLANVWGLTEATSIATFTDGADYLAHPGSAGTALDGVDIAVSVDGGMPEDVRNTAGELCIRGPVVAGGYWNNPAATADTFVGGWLHTGDVGFVDGDGHVYVKDRLKDMIIRGGENIYSLEVENVLIAHPDVAEVAVVGVPDEVLGEKVCAVIVVAAGTAPTPEDLRMFAAQSLADYKVPSRYVFVEQLPRNAAGKVLKRTLAADIHITTGTHN
jgi:fatty-acyl-CoA synthase